jgi:hypothetical protein
MIFGLISGVANVGDGPTLCIIPDKPSPFSVPIKISSLIPTDCAIHFVSVEEGFTVTLDPNDNGTIISAVRPNVIFLTPNLPHRPGFRVDRIKIMTLPHDHHATFFDRGKGWENWNPNRQIL